jgi:hypothetical protein
MGDLIILGGKKNSVIVTKLFLSVNSISSLVVNYTVPKNGTVELHISTYHLVNTAIAVCAYLTAIF